MRRSLEYAMNKAFEETTMKNVPIDQFWSFKRRNGAQNWNLCEKLNHQYLPLFLASCFFFISLSQTSSQHHCLPDQSAHLLQLRQEFTEKRMHFDYYDYYNGSYPKLKSWKANSDWLRPDQQLALWASQL